MFWPQLSLAVLLATAPAALAQRVSISGTTTYRAQPSAAAAQARTDAILAALSAEAGILYLPDARAAAIATISDGTEPTESRLCVRVGLGLSVPVMAGPQMTMEHGLIGCPTQTGGLPVVVLQDPALQAPPTARAGDYNLDLTVRYRLLMLKHLQILAVASEQGVGYSLGSPVSGNNLLVGMSLVF